MMTSNPDPHDLARRVTAAEERLDDLAHVRVQLFAAREALRAVTALHTGEHVCSVPGSSTVVPPVRWRAGMPCPTAVIVEAALSGADAEGAR